MLYEEFRKIANSAGYLANYTLFEVCETSYMELPHTREKDDFVHRWLRSSAALAGLTKKAWNNWVRRENALKGFDLTAIKLIQSIVNAHNVEEILKLDADGFELRHCVHWALFDEDENIREREEEIIDGVRKYVDYLSQMEV